MAVIPASRTIRPNLVSIQADFLPFLVPSIQHSRIAPYTPISHFSTSRTLWKRKDNNKNRGVSALRHTGPRPRQTLSVKLDQVPRPQLGEDGKLPLEGSPDHGLWGFFKDKKLLQTPAEESRHGKAWTTPELREKSWSDLHNLWWVCVKERNRLATEKIERARIEAGYGDRENEDRDETIQETMKAIQDTLLERFYAWEDAKNLAKNDPDFDLSGQGPTYQPQGYFYDNDIDETEREMDVAQGAENKGSDQHAKDLPKPNFFNTKENPPSLTEKVKAKTKKFLWNK